MRLVDTVKLATTTNDGYGDKTATVLTDVKSLFIQRSGVLHSDNRDARTSDATVYLDPTNDVVLENSYRLEGMYIIAQPFGQDQNESWYRITGVSVGQRKLLDNTIDNIFCSLQKVSGLHMFLSAKAHFDSIKPSIQLLRRAENTIPQEFIKLYKKNVVKITPMKSGALRRSIITQKLGSTANISWRSRYAKAQDDGGHKVDKPVKGVNPKTGRYSTINAGFYRYRKYTTPGTGPNFATKAFRATTAQMAPIYAEQGFKT